jgi:hypothetical protein
MDIPTSLEGTGSGDLVGEGGKTSSCDLEEKPPSNCLLRLTELFTYSEGNIYMSLWTLFTCSNFGLTTQ